MNTAELVDLIAKRKGSVDYTIPNPKSSPKEIVGHHGHRPAGKSILWPALYRHLRAKGYTKAKAAAISNAQWNKKHGMGAKNAVHGRLEKAMNYGSADAADRSLTRTQRPGAAPRAAAPAAQGAAPQQQEQKKKGKRKRKTNRTLSGKEVQQRRNAARGRRKQQNEDQEKTKKFYDAFNQLDPKLQDIARKLFTAANSGGEMKLKDRDEEIMFQMALEQNGVKHTKNTVTIGDKKIKYGVG